VGRLNGIGAKADDERMITGNCERAVCLVVRIYLHLLVTRTVT
jgi:hypothetical protein